MNKRQLVRTIAKRLPFTTIRQVEEVLDVAGEVWADELAQPGGKAHIPGLGRLSIEVQTVRAAGVVHSSSGIVERVYGRFRPASELLQQLEEQDD